MNFSRQQAYDFQQRLFVKALELIVKKRNDYCKFGPLDNFYHSRFWGVEPWRGAAVRLMDKIVRLRNLMEQGGEGSVEDETMLDTVVDILNYVVLVYMLWLEANDIDYMSLFEEVECEEN